MKTLVEQIKTEYFYTTDENTKSMKTACKLTFAVNLEKLFNNLECYADLARIKKMIEDKVYRKWRNGKNFGAELYDIEDNVLIFTTVGVAKCCVTTDLERYDEYCGQHIALTRAQRKSYRTARYVLNIVNTTITQTLLEPVYQIMVHCDNAAFGCDKHIQELINSPK